MENKTIDLKGMFAKRIRTELDNRKMSVSELAERSEFAPSLISRLITENDNVRREPKIEHCLAISRVFEMPLAELVNGTEMENIWNEWMPKSEFDKEVQARNFAQMEATNLRVELAGVKREKDLLQGAYNKLTKEIENQMKYLINAQQEKEKVLIKYQAIQSQLTLAQDEKNRAIQQANNNYEAFIKIRAMLFSAQNQINLIKSESTDKAWIAGIFGAILGSAISSPPYKS